MFLFIVNAKELKIIHMLGESLFSDLQVRRMGGLVTCPQEMCFPFPSLIPIFQLWKHFYSLINHKY